MDNTLAALLQKYSQNSQHNQRRQLTHIQGDKKTLLKNGLCANPMAESTFYLALELVLGALPA